MRINNIIYYLLYKKYVYKQENMIRIEKSSDLVFPESAKKMPDVINDNLESKSSFDMKGAILGGIASGIAFFGITEVVDRIRIGEDEELQEDEL